MTYVDQVTSSICSLYDQTWHCYFKNHCPILALFPGLYHPQIWLFVVHTANYQKLDLEKAGNRTMAHIV